MEMKILGVKMVKNGTKGLNVTFEKHNQKNGATFLDSYDVSYGVPIGSGIRNWFMKLENHGSSMLGLDENVGCRVLSIGNVGGKISLNCNVMVYDNRSYNANAVPVSQGTEFAGYEDLVRCWEGLCDDVMVYIEGNSVPTFKQMILDLQEYGDEKQKKVVEGFDELSEVEQEQKAREILEKGNYIVLSPEDANVDF